MGPYINLQDARYLQHRQRVLNAVSDIDSSPPLVGVLNYVKFPKHKEDADRHEDIMKANIKLLINMTSILRSHGALQTFTKNSELVSSLGRSKKLLKELDKKNRAFGLRVLGAKAEVKSRLPPPKVITKRHHRKQHKKPAPKREHDFELPHLILAKYGENLKLPDEVQIMRTLLRPRIFFDLAITGSRPLGRLVIKLFTEACPQVVLEFVRLCKNQDIGRLKIKHLFAKLWLEGELQLLPDKPLKRIEYDMRAIDHNQSAGVLSFARRHLKGMHDFLDFAISFRKLSALNGRRVGFGLVQQGLRLLVSLQEYGTRNGKPKRDIIITNCGSL